MNTFLFRLKRRWNMTVTAFRSDCHFSVYYALLRVADELGGRLGFSKLSSAAHQKKDAYIFRYLENALLPVISQYESCEESGTYTENAPIWVCWWTGEDTAPPLVRQCIASIRKNAGKHPVILLSKYNINQYLSIPDQLLKKVDQNLICIANFSDYLRFSLLSAYGGLWLDATIFCTDVLPESFFLDPVFTCKIPESESKYVSKYRWTAFCFGGRQGNLLFKYMKDTLEHYWLSHNNAIDYLLVDHLLNLGYEKIPYIQDLIDQIPYNNLAYDELRAAMNASIPATEFDAIIQQHTLLYKLSWREHYAITTSDNTETVYSHFLSLTY